MGKRHSHHEKHVRGLRVFLADILAVKHGLYAVHWHVKGRGFLEIHKFTEEVYTFLFERYDEIAERILAFGESISPAPSNQLKYTTIKYVEFDFINVRDGWQLVKFYLRQLSTSAHRAREMYEHEATTAAILDEDIEKISKYLWLARHSCPCSDLPTVVEERVNALYEEIKIESESTCEHDSSKHESCPVCESKQDEKTKESSKHESCPACESDQDEKSEESSEHEPCSSCESEKTKD